MSANTKRRVVLVVFLLCPVACCAACGWACWYWWNGTNSFHEPKLVATVPNVTRSDSVHPTFAFPGNRLLVGGNALGLLDLDTGTREPFPVTANVDAATFSRGGEVLVCVSKDNTVTLLEAATGAERARFRVEGAMLFGWVGISPDGKIVVTTGKDLEDLIAWDVDTGRRQVSFGGPGQNTGEGVFSPDGRWLVTFGSRASFAKLWTVPEFAEQVTLAGHSGAIFDASFAPDSKLLATTSYDGIRLWDVPYGRPVAHFTGHIGPANALAFSPDGEFLAAGFGSPGKVFPGESPRVELWHVRRGQVVARWLAADRSWITGVGFTPDGTRLVTVKRGGEGKVWDVRSVTHSGE